MRTATAAELAVLASKDRADHVRVKIENADGVMVEVTNLAGHDWVDDVTIDVRVEPLISTATITLFRTIGLLSLAPLIESSGLNVDSAGSYAPLVYPNRMATVETASKLQGEAPESGDWVLVWEGLGKVVEWGGSDNKVTFEALDPMTRLARTFIRTVTDYGSDALDEDMEDVIQEILDDVFGASEIELAFTATSFAMLERPLGNVTVLEALQAIIDLNAWNLHWRWNTSAGSFRLTLWEPDRANTTAVHTLGPDDYYEIPRISLDDEGVRNDGEVVYTDTSGDVQTETDTRGPSIALYETRFIRVDARDSSVSTQPKAAALLEAILDDTESPLLPQEVDAAYFWPIELGDLLALSPGEYYDTEQKFGVFGYRHVLRTDDCRTYIIGSGKPSGGFERWHRGDGRETSEIATPTAAMQVSQSGSTGSLDLSITDPDLRITAIQFAEKTGAGAYGSLVSTWDRSTGTIGSDTTLTRGEDVTLAPKHSVSIRYVVTYTDRFGVSRTLEGAHSFDSDLVAEVTGCTITFDDDNEAVVSVQGDEDAANLYVTVGNGSSPADPTAGANDGSISGRTGTVETGVAITVGNDAFVKAVAADAGGNLGPVVESRERLAVVRVPVVAMTVAQSGTTGSLDLEIHDPALSVTNVQFAKKADAGSYGSLATTWDRSTGTIGASVDLTRGEDITLTSKHSVSIRWVVTYTDDAGGSRTLEGAHSFDSDLIPEIQTCEISFDANGNVDASVVGDEDCEDVLLTVGDGTTPADPTNASNHGTVAARAGVIETSQKITTGNDAVVKVRGAIDLGGGGEVLGPVRTFRQARRLGPFHQSTDASHTGDTLETTLKTITVPANTLGDNGHIVLEFLAQKQGTAGNWELRFYWGGTQEWLLAIGAAFTATDVTVKMFNLAATGAQAWKGVRLLTDDVLIAASQASVDTTQDQDIDITVKLSDAGDTVLLPFVNVRYEGTP